jgi:hypothetical protein
MIRRVSALMLALTLVVALLAIYPVWAQEQPAPEQAAPQEAAPEQPTQAQPAPEEATPAQPAPEQSVLLRLKFTPGEVMKYRIYADVQGTARMDMPMPQTGGVSGEMPLRIVVQGEGIAKVLRVDQAGAGRLRVSGDNLSMSMEMFGQKMQMVVKNGKYSVTQNGKQVEGGKVPMMPQGQKIPFLQEPIEVKIGPRGEVMDIVMPGFTEMMAMMPGVSMKDMMKSQILLPEQPLVAGQTWSDTRSETLPGTSSPVTYDIKMALNGIDTSGGRQIANIRVESLTTARDIDFSQAAAAAAANAPQGMPPMAGAVSVDQQVAGNMLFDAAHGKIVRFDFQASQQMSMHSTMQTPDAGQQSFGMAMQFTVKGALAKI